VPHCLRELTVQGDRREEKLYGVMDLLDLCDEADRYLRELSLIRKYRSMPVYQELQEEVENLFQLINAIYFKLSNKVKFAYNEIHRRVEEIRISMPQDTVALHRMKFGLYRKETLNQRAEADLAQLRDELLQDASELANYRSNPNKLRPREREMMREAEDYRALIVTNRTFYEFYRNSQSASSSSAGNAATTVFYQSFSALEQSLWPTFQNDLLNLESRLMRETCLDIPISSKKDCYIPKAEATLRLARRGLESYRMEIADKEAELVRKRTALEELARKESELLEAREYLTRLAESIQEIRPIN